MKADKTKVKLAMARACVNVGDLPKLAKMPAPTVKNVLTGRNVRPSSLGRVARALGCDPAELLQEGT